MQMIDASNQILRPAPQKHRSSGPVDDSYLDQYLKTGVSDVSMCAKGKIMVW